MNQVDNLRHLMIETSFINAEIALALISHHYCPALLLNGLDQLTSRPQIWITHLKPGAEKAIMQEIEAAQHVLAPQAVRHGQIFEM